MGFQRPLLIGFLNLRKRCDMKIFKCEAQGDTMYFNADSVDAARVRLIEVTSVPSLWEY